MRITASEPPPERVEIVFHAEALKVQYLSPDRGEITFEFIVGLDELGPGFHAGCNIQASRQRRALNLPGRSSGNFVNRDYASRHFRIRETPGCKCAQFRQFAGASSRKHHGSGHRLA
jgi:hypothetical protein